MEISIIITAYFLSQNFLFTSASDERTIFHFWMKKGTKSIIKLLGKLYMKI